MKSRFLKTLASIRNCTSGNATVLLALGTPLLVGGAGLGVDLAQWYSWKRELQFAVDQGAIAGAWARAADSSGNFYITRAQQEYDANLHMVGDFDSGATVTLEDYDGGTDNSVLVKASATSKLPFSAFLTGSATTVSVSAQAIYEPGGVYNPCIVALDKSSKSALKFHGSPSLDSDCGAGALSPASPAGRSDGGGPIDIPYVIVAGTFKDENGSFTGQVIENARNLSDPFDGLTPPDNPTPRSLSCPAATNYTATENVTVTTSYAYYTGSNKNNLTAYPGYPNPQSGSGPTTTTTTGVGLETIPTPNPNTTSEKSYLEIEGKGNNKVWEVRTTTTTKLYDNIVASTSSSANMLPGTYTDFDPECDLTLAPGVYVIDGANLKINAQYDISGQGVMFVLKNGAGIDINGGATINLSGMSESQLIAAGVSAADAARMENMLIFEDPDSPGAKDNKLNGNALTTLNGYIYTPNSGISLLGSASATSTCLMIASKTVEIGGTADMSSSCDPDLLEDKTAIATSSTIVRLVG